MYAGNYNGGTPVSYKVDGDLSGDDKVGLFVKVGTTDERVTLATNDSDIVGVIVTPTNRSASGSHVSVWQGGGYIDVQVGGTAIVRGQTILAAANGEAKGVAAPTAAQLNHSFGQALSAGAADGLVRITKP